ncbi:hypothetical protein ACOME3_004490 [Neoechinorhynchus agilis]
MLYAIDHNPEALEWLEKNIGLNNINNSRCIGVCGECQEVCPEDVADRIILGLIPSSKIAWKSAIKGLKRSKYNPGILHVHLVENTSIDKNELSSSILKKFEAITNERRFTVLHIEQVKSYAPKLTHFVADIQCAYLG